LKVEVNALDSAAAARPHQPGLLPCIAIPRGAASTPGGLDWRNARYVLGALAAASDACLDGRCAALVTGPVHKGIINDAGIAFRGHTEFLAERAGCEVVMLLAAPRLKVALATTHLPLREVAAAIDATRLEQTLRILARELSGRFRIARPRIAVLGLNPHAGEGGHLGHEESEFIAPLLARLRAEGFALEGPLAADTAFVPERLERYDAVLAMYHDQGLPVLKALGFGSAVNATLGLPYVRTSVDHGVALDLAASGGADPSSMIAAAQMAIELCGVDGAE
jgi:4-hydroxythreonine-4-phosphate dehydrogenase